MGDWKRRLRGALGMGLTWALAWGLAGVLLAMASSLVPPAWLAGQLEVFDAPAPAAAIPGFFAGAFFSVILSIAARNRRFHELSIPRFATYGALGGLMLTLFPTFLMLLGLASPGGGASIGFVTGLIVRNLGVPIMVASALCAAATLVLARRSERTELGGDANDYRAVGAGAPDLERAPTPIETESRRWP